MLSRYYLSVAGVTILLEADHPLVENKEFAPFFIAETAPDIRGIFRKAERLPEVPEQPLFADRCYRIAADAAGKLQKFFFENSEDPVCYAVSTCDPANRRIEVDYLESYMRCVSEVQNCFFHLGFESILLDRGKLCLHASCVDTAFGGILFSGVSGIGKSTQAELWCKFRGAKQINGDRPILGREGNDWMAWGSPYAGSSKCHVNDSCTIAAIVLLKQADSCSLRRLRPSEAFRGVWPGLTVRSWDRAYVETASALAIDLIGRIPVFEFCCTPDAQAVDFLEHALRKEYGL